MIRSFKDTEAAKIYARQRSKKLPLDIQQVALRKMRMLNNAVNLNDLRIPPANRLEKLSGNRAANTASGSTTSGASVSSGGMGTPMPLRLRIITKEVRS